VTHASSTPHAFRRAEAVFTAVATPGNGVAQDTASNTTSILLITSVAYSSLMGGRSSVSPL
jgi:hypothetical protein